jgi:hypothetical protein
MTNMVRSSKIRHKLGPSGCDPASLKGRANARRTCNVQDNDRRLRHWRHPLLSVQIVRGGVKDVDTHLPPAADRLAHCQWLLQQGDRLHPRHQRGDGKTPSAQHLQKIEHPQPYHAVQLRSDGTAPWPGDSPCRQTITARRSDNLDSHSNPRPGSLNLATEPHADGRLAIFGFHALPNYFSV